MIYTLNNSDDLRRYKTEIEDPQNEINLFDGNIIDEIKEMFKRKVKASVEINHIQFIQELMQRQKRDEVFIKGDFTNERWEGNSQLKKANYKASVLIDIPEDRIRYKPRIYFKMILLKHEDKKFYWERGEDRYIDLNIIKNYIIQSIEKERSLFDFKVKFEKENKLHYEDTFSYDYNAKTLIIQCKYRGYQDIPDERIYKEMVEKSVEINHIKFIKELRQEQEGDEVIIKGDFINDDWKGEFKLKKENNKKASVLIDIPEDRIRVKPRICFKMVLLNHEDNKFYWERGEDRYIDLDIIKNSIIQNKLHEDNFSYDYDSKTLEIQCEFREYHNEPDDSISKE